MTIPTSAITVCIAGMLSLAVAMGIGRFAFTPVLPLMIRDGQLEISTGAWLAAANYVGYFVGAMTAARLPMGSVRLAWFSLAAIAVTTAAMSLHHNALWLFLRFVAGVGSAWVFVATSVWCLGTLSRRRRNDLGPAVYAGVGLGIAMAGGYCLVAGLLGWAASLAWIHLGLLAMALAIPVLPVLRRTVDIPVRGALGSGGSKRAPSGTIGLVACYGVMGLGYILPATFLPAMARDITQSAVVFGSAWPLFGIAAAASTLAAGPAMRRTSRLRVWACCQWLMAIGALLPGILAGATSILLSALLVGSTFMVVTLAGVQEMRHRMPDQAGRWVGYLTASFALGQVAGPAATALLLAHPALAPAAIDLCLRAAALSLAISAAWLWRQSASAATSGS